MKHDLYCKNCQLKNEPGILPEFYDKGKNETVAIILDLIGDHEVKYNTLLTGHTGKLLRQIINKTENYNILLLPTFLCKPINSKGNLLKIINTCVPYINNLISKYKIKKYLMLGRNAVLLFERLTGIKTGNANLDQLDREGLKTKNNITYRITYHPNIYFKTKLDDILNSIIKAFNDIFEQDYIITLEDNIKLINEIQEQIKQIQKIDFNLEIDANYYDLINVTKGNDYFYYLFYKDGDKKILKIEPLTLIYNDNTIKNLNHLNIINITNKSELKYVNDIQYNKTIKKLSDLGLNYSLYIIDGTKLINHIAITTTLIKNLSFNIYKPTYIDIETIDDKIVLTTIIHNDKIYLFTDKEIKTDSAHEIIITKDIATDVNKFLKENAIIVAGWNVLFDIYYILNNAKNLDINDLKVDYLNNKYCNYPYYSIFDIMYLYEKFINGNSLKYSLDYIAKQELGKGKILTSETFEDLYKYNFEKFVEYNILDTILVKEIDDKLDISNLAQQIRIAIESPIDQDIITKHSKIGNLILIRDLLRQNKITSYAITKESLGVNLSGGFVQDPITSVIYC